MSSTWGTTESIKMPLNGLMIFQVLTNKITNWQCWYDLNKKFEAQRCKLKTITTELFFEKTYSFFFSYKFECVRVFVSRGSGIFICVWIHLDVRVNVILQVWVINQPFWAKKRGSYFFTASILDHLKSHLFHSNWRPWVSKL